MDTDQYPDPIKKAMKAAREKFEDGLITHPQLQVVIRMLHIIAVIVSENQADMDSE